jgi:hypothetical protein
MNSKVLRLRELAVYRRKTRHFPMKPSKKTAASMFIVAALFALIAIQSPAADGSSTIVVPDDYPTITEAVGNATDGATILVRRGTYDGPQNQTLTINKTISLIGEDTRGTVLRLHPLWYELFILGQSCGWTWANFMQVYADDVLISGFTIESDGGIAWINGDRTQIVGNIVKANLILNGSRQVFAYNVLTQGTYSNETLNVYSRGQVECSGTYNQVAANTMANGNIAIMGSQGTVFGNSGVGSIGTGGTSNSNVIYNNTLHDGGGIWGASTHLTIAYNNVTNSSTDGVAIAWGYYNTVYCNVVTGCLGAGLLEEDNAGANRFYANQVENNVWGAKIAAWGSTTYNTTLYDNNFVGNLQQVNTDRNETIFSAGMNFTRRVNHGGFFDDGTVGNYWSNYHGTDADNNGIGDAPYVIDNNRSDHYPLMLPFDMATVTTQLPAWANVTVPTPLWEPVFPTQATSSPTSSASPPLSASPSPTSTSPTLSTEPTATAAGSPEPTPSIPEFPVLTAPFLLCVIATALAVYKNRKGGGHQFRHAT